MYFKRKTALSFALVGIRLKLINLVSFGWFIRDYRNELTEGCEVVLNLPAGPTCFIKAK